LVALGPVTIVLDSRAAPAALTTAVKPCDVVGLRHEPDRYKMHVSQAIPE
jgi:hypothetical protein